VIPPPFTIKAISYAWRQLAQRAGISFSRNASTGFEELGIPVFYGMPEQAQFTTPGLIISRCADTDWNMILSMPENSLHWIPVRDVMPPGSQSPFDNPIPVIFWGEANTKKSFVEHGVDGSIIFHADILASSLFMLSRWEEMVVPARDKHERFPASASVAYRQSFLDIPIIDQYGFILRAWLQALLPSWQPVKKIFSVKLSHDIDHVRMFNSSLQFFKSLGYELLKKHNFKGALKIIETGLMERVIPRFTPYSQSIVKLAAISKQNGMKSVFYFKASKSGRYDSGYSPEWNWVKEIITSLRNQGFEIGLHPGYQTLDDFEILMQEKKRFDEILGVKSYGGRQHYLRFRVPDTWRFWEEAGFSYDSSMGYHDHEGFRCGTCFPYHPFDLIDDREMNIMEIPLIVMEGSLAEYRGMPAEQGEQKILELARRSYEVGGVFTLLWHNTSLEKMSTSWSEAYYRIVYELSLMQKKLPA
jgi:hypothetical protein